MAQFVIHHRHTPDECGVVFASFQGFRSPLRRTRTLASCRSGGHDIWWTVDAEDEDAALRLLPYFTAERATATRVERVLIP